MYITCLERVKYRGTVCFSSLSDSVYSLCPLVKTWKKVLIITSKAKKLGQLSQRQHYFLNLQGVLLLELQSREHF